MSGLEVPALIAGIVGAAAGSVSAAKDASSFHSRSVTKVESNYLEDLKPLNTHDY